MAEHPEKAKKKRKRFPKHRLEARAYKFALGPKSAQTDRMFAILEPLWWLRNEMVVFLEAERKVNRERKIAGETDVEYTERAGLYKMTSKLAEENEALGNVHSHLRQNVAVRVIEGTKRWLEAVKEGRTHVKPPKPIDRQKYRSFTFPEYGNGCRIQNGRLFISGVGWVKMFNHRKVRGKNKTITVKFAQGRWWCVVTAQIFAVDLYEKADESKPDTAIDPGLTHLMADSHGWTYDPPRAWHDYRRKLRSAQKKMSRQIETRKMVHAKAVEEARIAGLPVPSIKDIPYSKRLRKQIVVVGKIHTKIENIRNYHHKKGAAIVADRANRVAVEEHSVNFMIRNSRLAKAASDRAIHKQKLLLKSRLGPRYVPTPNRRPGIGGNSQSCVCGAAVPKELKDRVHTCQSCGLVAGRDHVSANINQLIAFGTISDTLKEKFPAGRQPAIMRGEVKTGSGESTAGESRKAAKPSGASESSVKRGSLKSSNGNTPRVGNLPRETKPPRIATAKAETLPAESKARQSVRMPKGTTKPPFQKLHKGSSPPSGG